MSSELANHVEVAVVGVSPEGRAAEVGVVHELATALGPTHRLRLRVSVDFRRV